MSYPFDQLTFENLQTCEALSGHPVVRGTPTGKGLVSGTSLYLTTQGGEAKKCMLWRQRKTWPEESSCQQKSEKRERVVERQKERRVALKHIEARSWIFSPCLEVAVPFQGLMCRY